MPVDYTLAYGTHATPEEGRCAMEWVSHLAGEPHSDQPQCVSPVLRAVCIALNDGLEAEPRQALRPYLGRTIGTAGDGLDPARAWMALDWLVREYAPTWLDTAGLPVTAAELRSMATVLDERSLAVALPRLEGARGQARAARGAGQWSAARSVARELAWSCAGAAAWAGARLAVGDMAGDRARAGARVLGGDAATIAAQLALSASPPPEGRAAAKEVARAALAPTVERLRQSVFVLLDRMLPTEPITGHRGVSPPRGDPVAGPPGAVFTASV
ncbi:MAG: hypothetical protein QOF83_1654 [Solirubrobacteraceae bacterium]|jgi:hypothetical protein|nr:hypothetical protein [Solirubrobacteraceae bacterium]